MSEHASESVSQRPRSVERAQRGSAMSTVTEARIEADPTVPVIHITRDFAGTPEQLLRAHTDPEIFVRWVGPDSLSSHVDYWDSFAARDGWLQSGMEVGINEGYAKLDGLLSDGAV